MVSQRVTHGNMSDVTSNQRVTKGTLEGGTEIWKGDGTPGERERKRTTGMMWGKSG